jgi:hypothetical protein
MQTTTTFDKQKCAAVETAVMNVLDCNLHEIVNYPDTFSKKVVVFVLSKFYDFDKRNVGTAYQMTYLYVPTVVDELEFRMLTDWKFRETICLILNQLNYAAQVDFTGNRIASGSMA